MFSKIKAFFTRKKTIQNGLTNKQYEQIGRIIVDGALRDRAFNRAVSRLPMYTKLLEIIGAHPEQRKAKFIVRMFKLFKKQK
jgi:ribosomal protein L5